MQVLTYELQSAVYCLKITTFSVQSKVHGGTYLKWAWRKPVKAERWADYWRVSNLNQINCVQADSKATGKAPK